MIKFSRVLLIIAVVALSFLFVVFFIYNLDPITLDFVYYETVPLPKSLVLVVSFLAGILFGIMGMMSIVWAQKKRIKMLTREYNLISAELKAFRMRPLEEDREEYLDRDEDSHRESTTEDSGTSD